MPLHIKIHMELDLLTKKRLMRGIFAQKELDEIQTTVFSV